MNRRIRILAVVICLCFLGLFVQLNNLQIRIAPALQSSKYQPLPSDSDPYEQPRGEIISADGYVLAESTPTNDGYGEQRSYPFGKLFADITGYYDVAQSAAPLGIEAEYNSDLEYHDAEPTNLHQLLVDQNGTDSVVLTVSVKLQQVAAQALADSCPGEPGGCQQGAVVAVDVRTGAILAMYGTPTYDPNVLSAHDPTAVGKAFNALADPPASATSEGGYAHSPLINFATQFLDPPGSTMKVITTSAIFDHDSSLSNTVWPAVHLISLPDTTNTLSNFEGELCGGPLSEVLDKSCDTAFAEIGLKLGAQNLVDEAESFGFNQRPPLDLPSSEVSAAQIPSAATLQADQPFLAYSAIGQGNVEESALSDALVAAAIGDDGTIMTPHLLADVVDQDGSVISTYQPHAWRQATSAQTASTVRQLMRGVATEGTAAGVFLSQDHVAAKTGTAQTGTTGCSANWMTATAPADPGDTPTVAVAAVIPYQTGLSCGDTGATVAGPIVAKVLEAALAEQASQKGTP